MSLTLYFMDKAHPQDGNLGEEEIKQHRNRGIGKGNVEEDK